MKEPSSPSNEAERLRALQGLALLDTPPDERFDRITRLAQRLFGTEIALFSLVDADRQWFKSRQGLDAAETPRDISFCGHAILGAEPFVVLDTHDDTRFADNPLVTGAPSIRFYAGYPVSAPDGSKIGTLCIIDPEPRAFSDEDEKLLQDLGQTLEDEIVALRMATRDELTQIANRRGLHKIGSSSLALCRRANIPAELLLFDLDGFKAINDTLGHAAGDEALREFARCLEEVFRESDVVARLGGDEFCVLLTGSEAGLSKLPLDRLTARLAARNEDPGRKFDIAFSVGSVEFDPAKHESTEDLVAAADQCMYDMKRSQAAAAAGE